MNQCPLSPPKKGRSSNSLTPTKRRCVTTPPKKLRNHNRSNLPSLSPPLLRTPTKNRDTSEFSTTTWTSDRFIPNRSHLNVDLVRASVESAEKNLSKTFEKFAKNIGENGDPNNNNSSQSPVPPPQPQSPSSTPIQEEALTPLQVEFRRRMRGALLNIPMEDANSRMIASSSISSSNNNYENGSSSSAITSSITDSVGNSNRENIACMVYASLPSQQEEEEEASSSSVGPRRGFQRMLSFQGMRDDSSSSFRSKSSRSDSMGGTDDFSGSSSSHGMSSNGDRGTLALSPKLSPQRRLMRQQSFNSGLPHSPHRRSSPKPCYSPKPAAIDPFSHDQLHVLHRAASSNGGTGSQFDSLSQAENRLRSVAKSVGRRIPKTPSRILDAPELVDDYYLNLVSWGENNILAVALGQCVYLWEADTGNIRHLLQLRDDDDFVTSVSWVRDKANQNYIAIGTNHNAVQLWDAEAERRLRTLDGHSARVGALSWNQHWLSSGGRDSQIIQHDVRSRNHIVSTYVGHTQEVCGLRWNDDGSTLASGGNENLLCLWDAAMSRRGNSSGYNRSENFDQSNIGPRLHLMQHKAAVKALAWCPFHRGLLASGGGTADRTIKFWNTNSGAVLNSVDTGSQVCSLLWSKHQRELCSSHGFSENQLILWKYPTMTKIQEFKGHTARVLHMDQSPDGGCVVSAAADETLRFWDVFGSAPSERKATQLSMSNFGGSLMIR